MWDISGIPLPPPDNNLFINVKWGGRVKGPGYRKYCMNFEAWRLENHRQILAIKMALKEPKRLQVDFVMFFLRSSLFCKDGRIKRNDIQNRFKAICDLLSEAIGIDDRYFWRVSAEKAVDSKESVSALIKVLDDS